MAKASATAPAASTPASFETALTELEGIVQAMEGGRQALDESLAAYQRGMTLLKFCQEALTSAEQKIQILDNGNLRDLDLAETRAAGNKTADNN